MGFLSRLFGIEQAGQAARIFPYEERNQPLWDAYDVKATALLAAERVRSPVPAIKVDTNWSGGYSVFDWRVVDLNAALRFMMRSHGAPPPERPVVIASWWPRDHIFDTRDAADAWLAGYSAAQDSTNG